ncbi:hypothetical protein, partial [Aeromonas caviae]|uniref:hypothetical protein n=1 Tax=Aeromonas caviae TaxID=648 RepID=UPI001CC394B6
MHLHCITLRIKPRKLGIVEAHRNGMPALARLDSQRDAVQMQRGEYLRAAALHRLPPTIPEVNR